MNKEQLKTAFLDHDFDRAQVLVNEWGAAITKALHQAQGDVERRHIFDDALAFAEENLYLARVIRAHISTELQANTTSFLYRDCELEQHCWQFNG